MQYHDGIEVQLGDIVTLPVPSGSEKARVVMLGDTYQHLDIDCSFLDWVKRDKVLNPGAIVVEWLDANPFAHADPNFAPVGNYMFTVLDEFVVRGS